MKKSQSINPASHFVIGFNGTTVTPFLREMITQHKVAGVILFSRNIESPKQVRELNCELQKLVDYPLLISVDQEGGPVARLKNEPYTKIPPMGEVGEYYRRTHDIKTVKSIGTILGRELRATGFNWDFAPVVDVHSNPKNPVIGKRSFGPDPLLVAECARAVMRGLHDQKVLSCGKHFPGHGATAQDSHKELPILRDSGRVIWKRDVLPYKKLIANHSLKSVMTAHVRYPDLDKKNCATLSPDILQGMLRGRLKYRNLIVSDDFFMKAIADRMDVLTASRQFFKCSGDLALVCEEYPNLPDVFVALEKTLEKDRGLQKLFLQSRLRLQKIIKQFSLLNQELPPLSVLGCDEHRAIIDKIISFLSLLPAENDK